MGSDEPGDRPSDAIDKHERSQRDAADGVIERTNDSKTMQGNLGQRDHRHVIVDFHSAADELPQLQDELHDLPEVAPRTLGGAEPGTFDIQDTMALGQLSRHVMARRAVLGEPVVPEINDGRFQTIHDTGARGVRGTPVSHSAGVANDRFRRFTSATRRGITRAAWGWLSCISTMSPPWGGCFWKYEARSSADGKWA